MTGYNKTYSSVISSSSGQEQQQQQQQQGTGTQHIHALMKQIPLASSLIYYYDKPNQTKPNKVNDVSSIPFLLLLLLLLVVPSYYYISVVSSIPLLYYYYFYSSSSSSIHSLSLYLVIV